MDKIIALQNDNVPKTLPDWLQLRQTERESLIERLRVLLKADPQVKAAWLHGSLGRGESDGLSDIDLWVVVTEGCIPLTPTTRRNKIQQLDQPLLILETPQNSPPQGASAIALFKGQAGAQQVDWFWQPQSLAQRPTGVRLLFDRVGLASSHLPEPFSTPELAVMPAQLAEAVTDRANFFWTMLNITAKYVARQDGWTVIRMTEMVAITLREVERYLGRADGLPTYKSGLTGQPPATPLAQLALLRGLARKMETLTPAILALGASVPDEAIEEIYHFFDLIETTFIGEE